MKYTFKVLLLTRPATRASLWDHHNFLPGSREKNYLELLTGQGIPFDYRPVDDLRPEDLLSDKVVRYSAIIFAAPFNRLSPRLRDYLADYSFQYGVILLADSFLFKKNRDFFSAFGLQRCSGFRFGCQQITDRAGQLLYRTRCYPYSARGRDLGFRPLLRMLMQSWLAKRTVFDQSAAPFAAFADNTPAISAFPFGRATNYVLNFHPAMVLADGNYLHRTIKKILTCNSQIPAVSFDLENIICLRLDDPGSCERVHLKGFNPGVISGDDWRRLAHSLRRSKLHLNIAYVPQWVDDGDASRGVLMHRGKTVHDRQAGRLYSSKEIMYSSRGARTPTHDYCSEFKEIKAGVEGGVFSIVAHGLTHLSTDIKAWRQASDRYTNKNWYREFREMAGGRRQSPEKLLARLVKNRQLLQEAFGRKPDVIVPSAHEHTPPIIEAAAMAGFKLFSSRATYLLHPQRTIVNRKLMAFYPEELEAAQNYSRAGYPVIFACHDYDLFRHGIDWLLEQADRFRQWGIKHFLPLADLGCLLLADIDTESDHSGIIIKIDFSQAPQPVDPNFQVPLKIGGQVTGIKVNDRPFSGQLAFRDGCTRISIPGREIEQSRLQISCTLPG